MIQKKCQVCGDKALGFNFDGLPSCSSCRVFFYRNAANRSVLKCSKRDENSFCTIDLLSRKSCPKCRLEKCIFIGMRLRPGQLIKLQQQQNQLEQNTKEVCQELEEINLRSLLNSLGKEENSGKVKKNLLTSKLPSIELSFFEHQEVAELGQIISASLREEACCPEVIGETTGIYYLSTLAGVYGRRQCHLVKRIPLFNWLKPDLQLELFRHFCFDFMVVRAAFQLNRKTGLFRLFTNEIGSQTVDVRIDTSFTACPQLIHENLAIMSHLSAEMEGDRTVRNLLSAILLVKQSLPGCEPVCYQYHFYCRLLKRYLAHKYSASEHNSAGSESGEEFAFRRYCTLMKTIHEDLDRVKANMRFLLYEIGVHQVADIVAEVMCLHEEKLETPGNSSTSKTTSLDFRAL